MSWRAWTEEGFGIQLLTGDNLDAIKAFVRKRIDQEDDRIDEIDELEDEYDFYDMFDEPLAHLIAGFIRDETGYNSICGYDSCGDTNSPAYIGFCTGEPWSFEGKDKTLTKYKAIEVLNKYAKELEIDMVPDYFTAEYCG